MKKLLSYLFLLVAVITLASCEAVVFVDSLEVSGQKTEFVLGDAFETGEITVIAIYTNGNEVDVTEKIKVTPSTDMSTAGIYAVEVYYEGAAYEYNIEIVEPELQSITLDTTSVKKVYTIGEELSIAGLVVTGTYENKFTGTTYAEIENYSVVVANSEGQVVEGALEYVGEYTVTVSVGSVSASYVVSVSNECASVAEAVAMGVANASKVASGTHTSITWSTSVINYAFGENYFTYSDEYGYTYHYSLTKDEEVLGACVSDYGVSNYSGGSTDLLLGYNQYVLYYSLELYGAEAFVAELYNLGLEAGVQILESIEEGVYNYSYNYTISEEYWDGSIEYYYYNVAVSFKLGLGGEFSEVVYTQSQYYTDEVVVADDGSWTVVEDVVSSNVYQYKFEQVLGERNLDNPYSEEKLIYSSFDFVDSEGQPAASEYTVNIQEQVILTIGNALPETANANFNNFTFECEDDSLYFYAYVYNGYARITPYDAGTYNITITCAEIVKQITITAVQPNPEVIYTYASELVESYWGEVYEMVETSSVTIEAGEKLYVGAEVYPYAASQEIVMSLKEEYEGVSLSEVLYSDWDAPYFDGAMMNFNAENPGTYVIVYTSAVDSSVAAELTVVVTEAASEVVESTFEGTWTALNPYTGMTLATIEVYSGYAYFSDGSSQIMMTWEESEGVVTFTVGLAYQGTLSITDAYVNEDYTSMSAVVTYYGTEMSLTFTKPSASIEESTITGDWSGTYPFSETINLPCECSITLNEDGTGSGKFNNKEVTFLYSADNGTISFTDVVTDGTVTFSIGVYELDFSEMTIYLSNGVVATLSK